MSTALSSSAITSWWYGQGGAEQAVRRLESLYALSPRPSQPGVITVRRDTLKVTFVESLKTPLPHPWRPAGDNASEIDCTAVNPDLPPDPDHPVYAVGFGITDPGDLLVLNLAAFSRIRVSGDIDTARALVSRWIVEMLATHPSTTIGVSSDVWDGPATRRIHRVAAGHVPGTDVLILGPHLSYAERTQIVENSSSGILIDLGADAAVTTKWVITCDKDHTGQILNEDRPANPTAVTLIIPTSAAMKQWSGWLTEPATGAAPAGPEATDPDPAPAPADPSPALVELTETTQAPDDYDYDDYFDPNSTAWDVDDPHSPLRADPAATDSDAPPAAIAAAEHVDDQDEDDPIQTTPPTTDSTPAAPQLVVAPPDTQTTEPTAPTAQTVEVAKIWNTLLGQITLTPPHPGPSSKDREKRHCELVAYLQWRRSAGASVEEIVANCYSGGTSVQSLTSEMSRLRRSLGEAHPGGPPALPQRPRGTTDTKFLLLPEVRSDWMEFDRLVEPIIPTTAVSHLAAAMNLVTGSPLGGVGDKDWAWATKLRERIRDRVAETAVTLASHYHQSENHAAALQIARKGLWYATDRQDLWQVALGAALDGGDNAAVRDLRNQCITEISTVKMEPALAALIGQTGG
ncbi:bacterial transcriptional activator domain-containing protein (plasmid) [Mycolicibacterium aubagnense]|uniref:AfsR/SARP family transcriptional regulator n=1 Tax=Mycolicibacterium aubagnense TaxID=319707 RepID=UPI00244E1EF9|nr:bacterial transcriptional activator domain-containing protein [Mycolicibacterium aubagnense]WGI35973.1 bacterial transcriptional activator domain-containing protein [Mycolicibacterium aubagnense]